MSCGDGGGPPVSSTAASREPSAGTKLAGGSSGGVETEWKQQRENPVVAVPQGLGRWQQSPQETAPAATGQRMPRATSPRKIHARRPRHMAFL
jgi:hypothetical protein